MLLIQFGNTGMLLGRSEIAIPFALMKNLRFKSRHLKKEVLFRLTPSLYLKFFHPVKNIIALSMIWNKRKYICIVFKSVQQSGERCNRNKTYN